MRAGDLYRLGRHLMEVARVGMTDPSDPGVFQTDSLIIDVVVDRPGSSINEITAMAGFAQSHVSASVNGMRERGWVRTSPDPADGRRTLVWAVEALSDAIARREERSAEMILAAALSDLPGSGDELVELDRAKLTTFTEVLEELHHRLTARALHRVARDHGHAGDRSGTSSRASSAPPGRSGTEKRGTGKSAAGSAR